MCDVSSTFELILRKADASSAEAESWKADHDEAMRVLELNLMYEEAGALFRSVLLVDARTSEEERAESGREQALLALARLCRRVASLCGAVPVEDYDYPLSADKLEYMASTIDAMLRGVKVWDPADSSAASDALAQSETIGLDELRQRLQP
jgi:hypothetical protein